MEKIKYEFTKEEVNLLWEMVDVCLKAGGLSNLIKMHEMAQVLQRPVQEVLLNKKK